jgi:energy-coupling factor transporter ATP-binding protein EcfA2
MASLKDIAKSLAVPTITVFGEDANGNSSVIGSAALTFKATASAMTFEISFDNNTKSVPMDQDVVENIKNEVLTLEEYMQEDEFCDLVEQSIFGIATTTHGVTNITCDWGTVTSGNITTANKLTQKSVASLKTKENKDLAKLVPQEYKVMAAPYYTPVKKFFTQIAFHLVSGAPAVAILGPTGSGKSEMAKHIGSYLEKRGTATYVLQGDSHLLTEHLFDMMDFTADKGIQPVHGSICDFARKTKELGIKGMVIIDEWGAMKDATRRPFYPLFSRHNRFYVPQITKDDMHLDPVDFSHVQFLLTANPPHVQYLTDDLRPMTCAEARRITCIEMPYETDRKELIEIFKNIVRGTDTYQKIKADHGGTPPEDDINWDIAVKVFLALNAESDSPIRYDVSYEQIATAYWNAAIFEKIASNDTSNILYKQLCYSIFNGISDQNTREDLVDRVRQQSIGIIKP